MVNSTEKILSAYCISCSVPTLHGNIELDVSGALVTVIIPGAAASLIRV